MTAERAPIFDDLQRTDGPSSEHGERIFDFLNRVAGDYWEHPRQLMQAWADRIHDSPDYNDLRQRFRSHDDDQFRSAFLSGTESRTGDGRRAGKGWALSSERRRCPGRYRS